MNFYNENESFDNFEGIQVKERELVRSLSQSHPAFSIKRSIRKPEKFSNLSAEERFNFIKKINSLQKLINEIQTSTQSEIPQSGFTLE